MKCTALFMTGVLAVTGTAYAGLPGESIPMEWVSEFDSAFQDSVGDIAVDAAGNSYVAGFTAPNQTPSATDILVVKFASDGTLVWAVEFGGPVSGQDFATDIAIDANGDVIVGGRGESNGSDNLVAKLNADNGAVIWSTILDVAGFGQVNAIATSDSGAIFAAGQVFTTDQNDFVTARLDPNGNVIWIETYDGPGPLLLSNDSADAIAIDSNGDVFVTGASNGPSGNEDYVTIKYDGSNGDMIWLDRYTGAGANDIPVDILIDSDDNVYVTGSTFQAGWKYATIRHDNASGSRIWVAIDDPGAFRDFAVALDADSAGDVFVTGTSDPDGNDDNFNENIVVVKHQASDGAQMWLTIHGENDFNDLDFPTDLVIDAADQVFITGRTSSFGAASDLVLLQFDPVTGEDLAIATFDSGDAAVFTTGHEMTLDGDQRVLIAGVARNTNTEARDTLALKFATNITTPGDIDGDGDVDSTDLLALLAAWGDCKNPDNCPGDFNRDGTVGTSDLLELLANWST